MAPRSGPTVTENFGVNMLLFGQVVAASLQRHQLSEAPNTQRAPPEQTVIFSPGSGARTAPESSGHQSGGVSSWTDADIDLLEHGEGLSKLHARMTGTGGGHS